MLIRLRAPFLLVCALMAVLVAEAASADYKTLVFTGTERVIGNNPPPQVLWSPFIPVGAQVGTRTSYGIRISAPSLRVHCPVQLKVNWDPALAKGGRELELRIKVEPTSATGSEKTLDSNFGVDLPTRIQVGLLGISGLPDIIPWFDLPIDLWATLSLLERPFNLIPAAIANASVSMQSTNALPLGIGSTSKFNDSRALIAISFSTLAEAGKKSALVTRLSNSIPRKNQIKTALTLVSALDADQIEQKINSTLGQGVNLLSNLGQFSIIGEPYWKIGNGELQVVIKYRICGKFLEGTLPVTFPGPGLLSDGSRLVKLRLPYFLKSTDKLEVFLTRVEYRFDLYQGLGGKLNLSGPSVNLPTYEKKIGRLIAAKEFSDDPQDTMRKISLPLSPSDQPLGNVWVVPGSDAVRLAFATNRPGRGVLLVSDAATHAVVKRVEGRPNQRYHFLWATGLASNHAYLVDGYCVTNDGNLYSPGQSYSVTTKSSPTQYSAIENVNGTEFTGNPSVEAGLDWLKFSWTTNTPATTEVRLTPSMDVVRVHLPISKHTNGTLIGGLDNILTDLGPKELTTNHSVRVTGLSPGTTYYYSVHSGIYNGAVQADNLLGTIRYNGSAQTTGSPTVPLRILATKAPNQPVKGVSVFVFRTSPDYHVRGYFTTGNDGHTPPIMVQPGEVYRLESKNHSCYQDNMVTYTVPLGNAAPQAEIRVTSRPTGLAVLTSKGAALSGAKVRFIGTGGTHYTNLNGLLNLNGLSSGLHEVEISKAGFFTTRVPIAFNDCGALEKRLISLSPTSAQLKVRVMGTNLLTKATEPMSGAQVKLIPSSGSPQDLGTTNGAGELNTTIAFSSLQNRTYRLQVLSAYDSPYYVGYSPLVTHRPGVDQVVEVYPPVRLPPLIRNVKLQTISEGLRLSFRLMEPGNGDEFKGQGGADYRTPDGLNKSLPFTGAMTRNHDKTIAETAWGCYQVQALAKDRFNRVVKDISPVEFLRFSDEAFNLRANQGPGQSAVISWNPLKGCSRFANYVLTMEGRPQINLNDVNTCSHTFHGLTPRKNYKITLRAQDSSKGPLTPTVKLNLTMASLAPVIHNFAVTPAEPVTKSKVIISAFVTDTDSDKLTLRLKLDGRKIARQTYNTNRAEFRHEFKAPLPGIHILLLEASDESNTQRKTLTLKVGRPQAPPKITARLKTKKLTLKQNCRVYITLNNPNETAKPVQVQTDWGDQTRETKALRAKLTMSHGYNKEGKFTLTITPQAGNRQNPTLILTGEPVILKVEVALIPPRMRLNCTGTKNRKIFKMAVLSQAERLTRWQLEFGDGSPSAGGQGLPPAMLTHCYPKTLSKKQGGTTRTHRAVLTVWDRKNHSFEKIKEVKVRPGADDECLGQKQLDGNGFRNLRKQRNNNKTGSDNRPGEGKQLK